MSLPSLPDKTTLYQISLLFMGALCCTGKFALTASLNGEMGFSQSPSAQRGFCHWRGKTYPLKAKQNWHWKKSSDKKEGIRENQFRGELIQSRKYPVRDRYTKCRILHLS